MNRTQKFLLDLIMTAIIIGGLAYFANANAAYTEFKKGERIYYVYDDVLKVSFYPEDATQAYLTAKSLGNVLVNELDPSDYIYSPENLRRSQLKQKLKGADLNLIEMNEYLRLLQK